MSEGALTFQPEQASACFNEAKPLMERNWAEISPDEDIALDPAWEVYEAAERLGMLRAYSVRQDGVMQGYATFFVTANPHCRSSLQAVQDILYIVPEARIGMTGVDFIKWCDRQLAAEGVQVVRHYVTKRRDFGRVLKALGYTEVATVWSKRLDKERGNG